MEAMLSSSDQQRLVSSFLEIAVGQTAETARQFLELFYVGGEGGNGMLPSGTHTQPASGNHMAAQSWGAANTRILQNDVDEFRPPLHVARENLYGDSMYYGAMSVLEPNEGASSASASASETESASRDSFASLYRPPFHLMLHGSFEQFLRNLQVATSLMLLLMINSHKEEELERFEKAKRYTDIHNLRKEAQDILEKGYNDQGFYVSTKLKCLEKNSSDAEDVPYTKWLVVRKVGNPFSYWDISTHMDYKNSRFSKDPIKVNLMVDNRPKVSGDISLGVDSAKLITSFGAPDFLESMKVEFLAFHEHMALRVRGSGFKKEGLTLFEKERDFTTPKRIDVSASMYASGLKFSGEASYAIGSGNFMKGRFMSGCVGAAMKTSDIMGSFIYWSDSWTGSLVKYFSWCRLGIEVSKPISSNQCTWTLGACIPKGNQTYKVKYNNSGVISGCLESRLGTCVVSVSGQADLKQVGKCPKVGLKVLFKSSALQTYDVGVEGWG